MPLDQWPTLDRQMWLAAIAPTDPFSESGGTRANHRPLSNRNVVRGYGRWLTWRGLIGASTTTHPADAITSESTIAYVTELERCNNKKGTILARLEELCEMAKILDPSRDWSFIGRIAAKVRARRDPSSNKPPLRVSANELVDLGFRLMELGSRREGTRRGAVLFRDGLLIALAAFRPLRLCNLTELTIGRDLIETNGNWTIAIPREASKTHVPLEFEWPTILSASLSRYLTGHRHLLSRRKGRWRREIGGRLWVSTDGSPLGQKAIFDRIKRHTADHFGFAINPHKFRNIAATTLAMYDPLHVRAAAPVLGHSSLQTTHNAYIQAGTLPASRGFGSHLAAARKAGRSCVESMREFHDHERPD